MMLTALAQRQYQVLMPSRWAGERSAEEGDRVKHAPSAVRASGHSRPNRPTRQGRRALHKVWQRTALLAGAAAVASLLLPSAAGNAARGNPMPSLQALVARAKVLSDQINTLNEQANGLKIQLGQARTEAGVAQHTYRRDLIELAGGQRAVGQLAAQSYMNGGSDSILQLLTTTNPETLINRASILQELQQENGEKVSQIQQAVLAAQRARDAGLQQTQQARKLTAEIATKRQQAQSKISLLNSSVFAKAMTVFNQTGHYPVINLPTANTIGAQALQWALSMRGAPYVWGAAGPTKAAGFDCSGLVMWAYSKVGISLPHFAADQYNMGIHVSQNQLEPGDLVFFYSDIGHVGMYIGNGMMVDAPDFGQVVQVQPVMWSVFVGAVRIVG